MQASKLIGQVGLILALSASPTYPATLKTEMAVSGSDLMHVLPFVVSFEEVFGPETAADEGKSDPRANNPLPSDSVLNSLSELGRAHDAFFDADGAAPVPNDLTVRETPADYLLSSTRRETAPAGPGSPDDFVAFRSVRLFTPFMERELDLPFPGR